MRERREAAERRSGAEVEREIPAGFRVQEASAAVRLVQDGGSGSILSIRGRSVGHALMSHPQRPRASTARQRSGDRCNHNKEIRTEAEEEEEDEEEGMVTWEDAILPYTSTPLNARARTHARTHNLQIAAKTADDEEAHMRNRRHINFVSQ